MSTGLGIVLAGIAALVIFIIVAYNRLVELSQRGREAWSDVDVQLKRRSDLVPNLVETVKGYAAHERGTLDQVVHARNAAVTSPTLETRAYWSSTPRQPSSSVSAPRRRRGRCAPAWPTATSSPRRTRSRSS